MVLHFSSYSLVLRGFYVELKALWPVIHALARPVQQPQSNVVKGCPSLYGSVVSPV